MKICVVNSYLKKIGQKFRSRYMSKYDLLLRATLKRHKALSATEMVPGDYSVRPSVLFTCIVATFNGRIYMKFDIGDFYENLLRT
jgi:hypothetical protein